LHFEAVDCNLDLYVGGINQLSKPNQRSDMTASLGNCQAETRRRTSKHQLKEAVVTASPSLLKHLQALLLSIDTCLSYYFLTAATDKIRVQELEVRVARNSGLSLTTQHLQHIKFIWNDVFDLYIDQSGLNLSIQRLPLNPKERSQVFASCCRYKKHQCLELHPIVNRTPPAKRAAEERLESLRKCPEKPKLVVSFDRSGSLLDRIKAKEKAANSNPPTVLEKEQYSKFIIGQLESITRVLVTLTSPYSQQPSTCVSFEEIFKLLSDSLKSKLTFAEIQNALAILAQYIPKFCVLITMGNIRAVRIYRGWTNETVQNYLLQSKKEKDITSPKSSIDEINV
jgi:DNA replication factor Cdt1 C-terminal domain